MGNSPRLNLQSFILIKIKAMIQRLTTKVMMMVIICILNNSLLSILLQRYFQRTSPKQTNMMITTDREMSRCFAVTGGLKQYKQSTEQFLHYKGNSDEANYVNNDEHKNKDDGLEVWWCLCKHELVSNDNRKQQ